MDVVLRGLPLKELVNWWAVRSHLRALTGAQVKPSTVQRYLEEIDRARKALDSVIVSAYDKRRNARRVQKLPHEPKLEPDVVPALRLAIEPVIDEATGVEGLRRASRE